MTPEERAEKILVKCLAMRREFVPPHILSEVAAQIREAIVASLQGSEAFEWGRNESNPHGAYCRGFNDGKHAGYEDAAKIAEGHSSNDELLHEAFKIVAEKIRTRKNEVCK